MSRRNRNKLLIPEARQELNDFKAKVLAQDGVIPAGTKPEDVSAEVAKEMGIPFSDEYNGDLTTEKAGKIGGKIGGRMVKELVRLAQEELAKNHKNLK